MLNVRPFQEKRSIFSKDFQIFDVGSIRIAPINRKPYPFVAITVVLAVIAKT